MFNSRFIILKFDLDSQRPGFFFCLIILCKAFSEDSSNFNIKCQVEDKIGDYGSTNLIWNNQKYLKNLNIKLLPSDVHAIPKLYTKWRKIK